MFKEGEIVYVNDEKLPPYLVGKFVGFFGSQNNILQFDVIVKGKNGKPQKKSILYTKDEARRCVIHGSV